MPEATYLQSSFLGGEWSPFMQGRYDRPDYRIALDTCLNFYPIESGLLVRRQGTQQIAPTRGGIVANILPFEFEQSFPYVLEFTTGIMRAFAGNQLALMNTALTVVSISAAKPALVTTSVAHTLSSGQSVIFPPSELGSNWNQLYNRVFVVTVQSPTSFTIGEQITGDSFDGSVLGPAPPHPVVSPIQEYGSPYSTQAHLDSLRIVQAESLAVILSGTISPRVIQVVSQPTPTAFATFSIGTTPTSELQGNGSGLSFVDGPYLDANTSTLTVGNQVLSSTFQFTINGPFPDTRSTGLTTADVGRAFRIYSTPPPYNAGTVYSHNQMVTASDGSFWSFIPAAPTTAPAPGTDATIWLPVAPGNASSWQWGTIITVPGPLQFTGAFANPLQNPVYMAFGATVTQWRLGLYGDRFGWPTCGCYHEGRLWLSGVIANRIDGSEVGRKFVFSPTEKDGTVTDANAISATFDANDTNPIFWMLSHPQGIVCGTQGGEWLVQATANNLPLTPTNIQAHRVTKLGCANIEPREAGATVVLVQRFARKVVEYFSDVFSGRLSAPNLTETAKHLTTSGIQQIAYQRELAPILWARMGDGTLKGVTYKRENLMSSQGPNFAGWHRHTLGSGRIVQRICRGASQNGDLDALFMVTHDSALNISYVEIMTDMFDEAGTLASAWFVDGAVNSTSYTQSDTALTVYGLFYYEGKTLSAWIGGLDCGDYAVSGGTITVPFGDGVSNDGTAKGMFTKTYFNSLTAPNVLVGFTYTSQAKLLRPNAPAETGARNGPAFGKLRRQEYFAIQLVNAVTNSISIGTDFTKMHPIRFRTDGQTPLSVQQTFSGVHRETLENGYTFDSQICWQVTRPYPVVIPAIGGFIKTQDV